MKDFRTYDVKERLKGIKKIVDLLLKAQNQKREIGERNFEYWLKELESNIEALKEITE